ncbi:Carbohydrate kinase [Lysobacter dokdonensis DS-58]|uniref:Bifunctional NAD(P)H-hydrate repair enzyme n=1 Tax=Lysobacter dokdonensis DS-58 TaxID=1300345 RepID=A0A0A2WJH6_9GAMM|nr:bifunctional ADP-dependent NAD(P)H-hydrate dehydratase/NAD(P)H-hydrate epimerase [Lysobacter dokdonensis]KGQ19968.1 Carbohydrate kinase [Lysobacter dokdonensis DS-58]
MLATLALYDTKAARALDARATTELGGDAFELMRRAGRAAWHCALRHWPQAQRIVVVCGPGNNGGDGYVLARLALEAGRNVRVVRLAEHSSSTPAAQRACDEFRQRNGRIETFIDALPPADLIVDALFGIGLSRAPEGNAKALIDAVNVHAAPRLSLDVPSGIDADTGAVPGAAVVATRTLEFIVPKPGLHTGTAMTLRGRLELAELQVASTIFEGIEPHSALLLPDALKGVLRPRRRDAHKGDSGRVLCLGGDHGSGGAIVLCAEAALRAGAGLVDVATREEHIGALLSRRPEAMARAVERSEDLAVQLERADVVAAGPGLGQGVWGRVLFGAALGSGKALVLDADALNLLATRENVSLPAGTILTPHPGEAARLLGMSTQDIQRDRHGAAFAIAEKFGAVVVLKGAGTVVAETGRRAGVIGAGNPGMAVGGMGDLLTGVIAALRAQGMPAFDAACVGALLHASAGDDAARDGGERGLMPSDLLPRLRRLANPDALR